jgi:hypothetical protein
VPGVSYTTDAQGDTVSITVPGQGTWSLNSSNGNVSFFPATGFTGNPTAISYTASDAAGLSSAPAAINIVYIVRPDLTPGVIMPSNTFVGQETKNAVLYLEEVRGGATAPGTALFRVRIPSGYVFTPYNASLSNITPSGGGAQAVANASYLVVSQSATQITLRAAPGVVIPANGIVFLGVTFTNVSGQSQATGNITIGIIADPDSVYDSQFSNNAYSRILSID